MNEHETWERATLDLIRRLEGDRLQKAEQRVAAAQRALAAVKAEIDALHHSLKIGRAEFGLSVDEPGKPDERLVAEYRNLSAREMLERWADAHGGQIVMRELSQFVVSAGIFRDKTQAAGALYPAVSRSEGFEQVTRGVYRRRTAAEPIADDWLDDPDLLDLDPDMDDLQGDHVPMPQAHSVNGHTTYPDTPQGASLPMPAT
jgi:hypothetical protein